MPKPALQVVLIGAEISQRQHLAQALQQVLRTLASEVSLHIPPHPDDLTACPADAAHLLWTQANSGPWRQQLHVLARPYQVVHGEPTEALRQCIYALLPPAQAQDWARQMPPVRWQGVCETCGDADCEQRLFSGLLKG